MLVVLFIAAYFSAVAFFLSRKEGVGSSTTPLREALVEAGVAISLIVAIVTQLLSLPSLLVPEVVVPFWALVALAFGWFGREGWRRFGDAWGAARAALRSLTLLTKACAVLVAALVVIPTAIQAVYTMPWLGDAMIYHLSRVEYWLQFGDVEPFATFEGRQVFFSPFYEYVLFHFRLLGAGDYLIHLPGYGYYLGGGVAASLVAGTLGASRSEQTFAALFAATVPQAAVQASAIKNETALAFFVVAFVYFGLRDIGRATLSRELVGFAAVSFALAGLTKAYFVFFALPFAVWFAIDYFRNGVRRALEVGAMYAAAGVIILAPFYLTNVALTGSPNGVLYYEGKEKMTSSTAAIVPFEDPREILSNMAKNGFTNLVTPVQGVNSALVRLNAFYHRTILGGYPVDSPNTNIGVEDAFPPFNLPTKQFFVGYFSNLSTAVAFLAALALVWFTGKDDPRRRRTLYFLAALLAVYLALASLKWSIQRARYFLTFFVLAAPFIAAALWRVGDEAKRRVRVGELAAVLAVAFSIVVTTMLTVFNQFNGFVPMTEIAQRFLHTPAPHYLTDAEFERFSECATQSGALEEPLDSYYVDLDGYRLRRGDLSGERKTRLADAFSRCGIFPYEGSFASNPEKRYAPVVGVVGDYRRVAQILDEAGARNIGVYGLAEYNLWRLLRETLDDEFELRSVRYLRDLAESRHYDADFAYEAVVAVQTMHEVGRNETPVDLRTLYPDEEIEEYHAFNEFQVIVFKTGSKKRFPV